jgi:hypothetical protein
MSLPRVSSIETFTTVPTGTQPRSRRNSDASTRARKLSFNPLPREWAPPAAKDDHLQAVGAFKVPKWKRVRKFKTTYPIITFFTVVRH